MDESVAGPVDSRLCTAAFFDVSSALAFVLMSADGDRVAELTVYPEVRETLIRLAKDGVRLGILHDLGQAPADDVLAGLERGGILSLFEQSLIVFGPKASPRAFRRAAALVTGAQTNGERRLLYVGEDSIELDYARQAGFLTAQHPRLTFAILHKPGPMQYLCIRAPEAGGTGVRAELRKHPLVPVGLTVEPGGSPVVYAITDQETAATLATQGYQVDRLTGVDEPGSSDLYLLQYDHELGHDFLDPSGESSVSPDLEFTSRYILESTAHGLLVSLPAGESVGRFQFHHGLHGHSQKLSPSVTLLKPDTPTSARAALGSHSLREIALADPLLQSEKDILDAYVTDVSMRTAVARYAGIAPGLGASRIRSRHIHHPANARAVEALVDDFSAIAPGLLTVTRHCFTHDQRKLSNVIATLPGTTARSEGVVVVSAHLDSTVTGEPSFCSATDPAPGADDDASGMAGVVAAAHACVSLLAQRQRRREIRFVLFNGEEEGRTGSFAYAQAQGALDVPIVAVFQMDMIGYDWKPPRRFEVHAGFGIPEAPNATDAQARSAELAALVKHLSKEVSPTLTLPEVFTDPDDPGWHSDHTRFHEAGYPACLITQDFHDAPGEAGDANPHYHKSTDRAINGAYAADIARVVAAAAWVVATR